MEILFVYNNLAPFILIDKDILKMKWTIREWYQSRFLANYLPLLGLIKSCDLVFGWFASWHTFLPLLLAKLFKKPSVLVIGGYDLANLPSIGYGHQRGGIERVISRWTMQLATYLVTNSEFSRNEAFHNAQIGEKNLQVIYHGVPDRVPRKLNPGKGSTVLTVGKIDRSNLMRKGLYPFILAAKELPDTQFQLVGEWVDDAVDLLKMEAPSNVEFTGWVEDERLEEIYSNASIYVQASSHEGFGMSLAEAMLAGCIPVVTRVGAIPEVVGDCGIYIDSNDPSEISLKIKIALQNGDNLRERARERVLNEFPLEKRQVALQRLISEIMFQ